MVNSSKADSIDKNIRKLSRNKINIPSEIQDILKGESRDSSEVEKRRFHVLKNIPYGNDIQYNKDIKLIAAELNKSHYGMSKAKQLILEALVASKYRQDLKLPYICLYGSPGVGKTSLFKSVSELLGAPFHIISLPGIESFTLKGTDLHYRDATHGAIINKIMISKCMNPIIIFDELDKVSIDDKFSKVSDILIAICDPMQNNSFVDAFLSVGIDISKASFFFTANDPNKIPEALRSRLLMIKIEDFTHEEKHSITKDFILPKKIKELNLSSRLSIDSDVIDYIVESGSFDEVSLMQCGGVREVSNFCESILNKATYQLEINDLDNLKITQEWITHEFGVSKIQAIKEQLKQHKSYKAQNKLRVGTIHSLATSTYSAINETIGLVDDVTCKIIPGSNLKFTGNMLDEPKDAATIAYTFIRANANKFFGKAGDILVEKDVVIHSHNPAIKKDGTSAGIVYMVAILSSALDLAVSDKVAMTGQLDLDGSITKVGGIEHKIGACIDGDLSTVFISAQNQQDVLTEHKDKINIITVENAFDLAALVFDKIIWYCEECGSNLHKESEESNKWVHNDKNNCINEFAYEGKISPCLNL